MLSGEELYKLYKQGHKTDISPLFDPEEWMCLYTYLCNQNEEDAFPVLEHALKDYPYYHPFLLTKVKIDLYDGFFEEALSLLENELADASDSDVKPLWIDYYFSTGDDDTAKKLLDDLFMHKPPYLESALEYLIPILRDVEDKETRLAYTKYIQQAAELFPRNRFLLEEWRDELKADSRMDAAVVVSNQLIDLEPYSFEYWDELGRLHAIQGHYEQAIEAFDFALTINDSESQATSVKILKGYCLYMNGSYEKAIEVYKEFQGDEFNESNVKAFLAHCHIQMKHYEEAYAILVELIKHDDIASYSFSIHDFVMCCLALNRSEEAYQALKEAVNKRPLDEGLLMMFSLVGIWDNRKMDEIQQTLDRSMALLNPMISDPSITAKCYKLLEIGKSYLKMGDKENALVYLDLILRIRPGMEELKQPLQEIFEDAENPRTAFADHMFNLISLGEASEEELAEYLCREDYRDAVDEDNCKKDLIHKFFTEEESNN